MLRSLCHVRRAFYIPFILHRRACVLDDEYILQCAEEVVHREQNVKLWTHSASSVSDDESVYPQR